MACGGCAERRKVIVDAWQRFKAMTSMATMSNGAERAGVRLKQQADAEAASSAQRAAEHERIKQRQAEMMAQARRRRPF